MDNVYNNQRSFIDERAESFMHYLHNEVLNEEAVRLLDIIASQTDVYVFSGVIRNYLLGFTENRDLDVVINNIDHLHLDVEVLKRCDIIKNSFGGYKIHLNNLTIDAWGIENTWGILEKKMDPSPYNLIKTAFFNFSSIAYNYNKHCFYYEEDVCKFLKTRVMDVVFPLNPNKPLCVLNTIYYARKYKFPLGFSLCKWVVNNYEETMPFKEVQQQHFHEIVISEDTIKWFANSLFGIVNNVSLDDSDALYFDFIQKRIVIVDVIK